MPGLLRLQEHRVGAQVGVHGGLAVDADLARSAQRQSTPNTPHQLRTDASREYMKSSHL